MRLFFLDRNLEINILSILLFFDFKEVFTWKKEDKKH